MLRAVFLMLLSVLPQARAQSLPPISIVVTYARGGGADYVARQLADGLPQILGEPVVVVQRLGNDGLAGVDEVMRTPPDGRTLLLGSTSSMTIAPIAVGRAPIDPLSELEPLAVIATTPRIVVVHPSIAARNLDELIRIARQDPKSLACGTGDRLSEHAARLFERLAGVRLDCVRYAGGAPLRKAMLSGERKLAFESSLLPDVQGGQLRAVAIAGRYRLRLLPDVPTASEAGMSGLEAIAWLGVFAPKGTSLERAEQLAKALMVVSQRPSFVAAIERRGYVPRPITGPSMRQFLELDRQGWRRAISARF